MCVLAWVDDGRAWCGHQSLYAFAEYIDIHTQHHTFLVWISNWPPFPMYWFLVSCVEWTRLWLNIAAYFMYTKLLRKKVVKPAAGYSNLLNGRHWSNENAFERLSLSIHMTLDTRNGMIFDWNWNKNSNEASHAQHQEQQQQQHLNVKLKEIKMEWKMTQNIHSFRYLLTTDGLTEWDARPIDVSTKCHIKVLNYYCQNDLIGCCMYTSQCHEAMPHIAHMRSYAKCRLQKSIRVSTARNIWFNTWTACRKCIGYFAMVFPSHAP